MRNFFLAQTIFQSGYRPGQSLLHQMSVSKKWILVFLFIICASSGSAILLICLTGICLLGAWIADVKFLVLVKLLYSIRWFLALIFLFPLIFTPGLTIESLGFIPIDITWEGLTDAFRSTLIIIDMFFMSTLFINTTDPNQIFQSIQRLNFCKDPRIKTKIETALSLGMWSIQLIPHICLEVEDFMLNKLEECNKENGWKGVKKAWQIALLLVPTLVHVLKHNQKFSEIISQTEFENRKMNLT